MPNSAVRVPAFVEMLPWVEDAEISRLPAGRKSYSAVLLAAPGPWLLTVTVMVKVDRRPTEAGVVCGSTRSAAGLAGTMGDWIEKSWPPDVAKASPLVPQRTSCSAVPLIPVT